jgi:O-antigen/teichoic acid export membrane protein
MRKKFATNLIFLFAVNLLVKPFWIFGIDRVVQNKIGTVDYGLYFALFNYSFLFSIILDFGINNFNNRAVSRNPQRLGEYWMNLMLIKFFLALIYFSLTILSASISGYSELQLKMLLVLILNQILLSAILYFRSNIAALQLFRIDSVISVLDRLLTISFCLVLLYHSAFKDSFTVMHFIYAQTAALLITAIVSGVVVAGRTVVQIRIWKWRFTKKILFKSAPFAMLALLMGIYYRIDGVMIERMLPDGKNEAGIYAASFRLLDAVNQFGFLFATLLLPMFAGMLRRKENINQLVKFSAELMLVMSVIAAVNCYFFRNEIMNLLYQNSTPYWSEIFGWLMITFIPMSSVFIFGTLLTAQGSLKILNMIAIAGMLLNICLNLFLIPKYGALGATFATLVTQIIVAFVHFVVAHRQFRFDFDKTNALKILAFSVSCFAVLAAVTQIPVGWVAELFLSSLFCLVSAIAFKLIPTTQVLALIKSKVG